MIEYVMNQTVLREEVYHQLANYDKLALDIETRGLNPFEHEVILLQLGWDDNAWVIDARLVDLQPLFKFLRDLNPLIIGHNISFDLKFLTHYYDFMPKRIYDTISANAILRNGQESYYTSLRKLVKRHADVVLDKDVRDTFRYTRGDLTQQQIDYAASDVLYIDKIFDAQLARLKKDSLIKTAQMEFDILPIAVKMHMTGMKIDVEKWKQLAEQQHKEVSEVEMQMAELMGNVDVQTSFFGEPKLSINPRSPKQMIAAFDKLGVSLQDTQADTLRKLDHPLAKLLLEHREKSKLASTYGLKFLDDLGPDGRIHAEYNPLGTRTGRFSSSGPNMQNIPAKEQYRSCFIAEDDYRIITADFSQVELKTAAVLSGEQAMIDEYNKQHADLHQLTADKIGTSRSKAKNINFGTLYGISEYGLHKKFDIPEKEGKILIQKFFQSYPSISKFMRNEANKALKRGYNTTVIGRRRYYKIPPSNDPEFGRKLSSIKRKAGNYVIQGTAGEIMKQALINVNSAISKHDAKLINTVHDELSIECHKDQMAVVLSLVSDNMQKAGEQIVDDTVKWSVGIEFGKHWRKA